MKKWFITVAVAVAIFLATSGTGYAVTQFYKQLAGVGNVDFVDQVAVTDITVKKDKVEVSLVSNTITEAGHVYTVGLYLNSALTQSQTVSWTAGQIPGNAKKVTFSPVDLSTVSSYGVEVTR